MTNEAVRKIDKLLSENDILEAIKDLPDHLKGLGGLFKDMAKDAVEQKPVGVGIETPPAGFQPQTPIPLDKIK